MSAVVLPAASADFTSTQVIFSNSTRSACARGAARADPAASTREAVPPAINISKECETEPTRMSFLLSSKTRIPQYSDARQKITQIHYYHDYNSSFARFSYASENVLGDPLLEDLRALVEFARPGPIAGAADRLFQTPSANTRQVQRLEAELAGLQGARTNARSATADRGAEISYVERRRTSRPLAHRARARPGRGDAYRTYSGVD